MNADTISGPQELPIFDHHTALAMLADDAELLAEVLAAFRTHVPGQMAELSRAIEAKSAAEVEWLAHGVKGAALNVHAQRIRQKAAEVEASAHAADMDLAGRQFVELEEEMARFEQHVATFDWTARG